MGAEELRGGSVYAVQPGGFRGHVRSVYQGDGFRVDAVPFVTPWGECVHVMVQGELVDQADVFHLWVLPDGFQLPFGLEET